MIGKDKCLEKWEHSAVVKEEKEEEIFYLEIQTPSVTHVATIRQLLIDYVISIFRLDVSRTLHKNQVRNIKTE